jgi:hypothetical protein
MFAVKPSGVDHFRGMIGELSAMPADKRPGLGVDLLAESAVLDGAMPGRQEGPP